MNTCLLFTELGKKEFVTSLLKSSTNNSNNDLAGFKHFSTQKNYLLSRIFYNNFIELDTAQLKILEKKEGGEGKGVKGPCGGVPPPPPPHD